MFMRLFCSAALLAVCLALVTASPAEAKGKGQGKGIGKGHKEVSSGEFRKTRDRDSTTVRVVRRDRRNDERRIRRDGERRGRVIDDDFDHSDVFSGLPPGLGKRYELPPGLAKRDSLPPGLAKWRSVPP